jgi:subtilisin family serine protease
VRDSEADSALDMAVFSSGGPLDDGRIKPDIAAPGTHIQGAASQHPDFDGAGVCGQAFDKPYFPAGQTLYTWSSGTSHSTPQVAGAAALARQYFLDRGEEPSAALIKALLVNTTTYMTGEGAGGNLPHPRQGWGLMNLNRAFDGASKILVNQTTTLTDSGQEFVLTGEVKVSSQPFRVTLAWSDAPGFSGFEPWVNDLDLEV